MSQLQKYAWWNLAVCILVLVPLLVALPFVGPGGASASFPFGALLWVAFIVWFGSGYILCTRRAGRVTMDERDRQIWELSMLVGYSIFWAAFVSACLVPRYIYGRDGAVPVYILQLYLPVAVCILRVTQSLVILLQYARGASHASE